MDVTASTSATSDDLLDDLLSSFTSKPLQKDTPEDAFIRSFTSTKFSKVAILSHWLRSQCCIYDRATEYGLCIADSMSKDGVRRVPFQRYARVLIEHYLMLSHPHWFIAGALSDNREPADMGLVIDRLMAIEEIRREIFSQNRS